MHEATGQQLAQDPRGAACGLELVHIGIAIGVHAGQQWHHGREFIKVRPVDQDARAARNRHPVDQVVGGAARGQQGHHGVDDAALVHQLADGGEAVAALADVEHGAQRLAGEGLARLGARRFKRRAGHMQAHGFQQHLVAVGRAVKRAGARAVVRSGLGLEQLVAPHQALCVLLAHLGFVLVRQARAHGACGHKHAGQVAIVQRTDQQARHDLVAHAQQQRAIKHIVGQRYRSGHGNGIAGEQRQLHAGRALRHAVAHRGHTARHLHRGAQLGGFVAQDGGVALVRLVGREHVVVGRDDADVGRLLDRDLELVGTRQRRIGMGQVGAAHAVLGGLASDHGIDACKVGAAGVCAALDNALGHARYNWVHGSLHRWVARPRAG